MRLNFSSWLNLLNFRPKNADFKNLMSELWDNTFARILFVISLFFNTLNWSAGILINSLSEEKIISLHHNIYLGITLIGSPSKIYFIPLFGLIIIIINLIFAHLVKKEDDFYVYIFSASSLLVNIFLFLGLASIMLINFR